jgi:RNA polymerase-binding transcription factor DksA
METVGESERAALSRIAIALERIERGTYDVCTFCGRRIDEARLRAVPETNRCAGCAATR